MKRQIGTVLAVVLLLTVFLGGAGPTGAQSGAPTVVSYQGQVTVGGAAYSGAGYFKFAVVNQVGTTTYWSNDGTSSGGSEPAAAVQLGVSNGLFSVLLGDASLANMTALPATAFGGTERYLRVWFSDDGATFTLLSPDRRIAAAPYALQAEEVRNGWRLTGNTGTAPATHFVGTFDAQPLVFRTNNVERMRLDTNGRMGLGSLPGTQRLTIRGVGSFSDWIQFQDDGGINQWHLNYSGGGFNFVESGVAENRLFLQDGGNVGIGTNDPQARLDVAGSIRTNSQLVSTVGAGTAPLVVASTTQVNNLNADLLDGQHATAFAAATHDHDATYVNEGQIDSITSAMIINGTITFGDVGQNGCANGQVMQWNGTAWACASVTGVTDHGALTGLGDDDHPQYFSLSQTETVTGIPAFNGGTSGTSAPFMVDSTYGVTNLNADLLDGQHASAFAGAAHHHDAAYVNEGQIDSVTSAMIVNGTIAFGDVGQNGCANGQVMQWNGTVWACASVAGVTDHGALTGLGDDDHPQYFSLSQAETVTGIPAFNGGTSGTSAPFTVDSTYGVTNLNADLLDGQHASAFAGATHHHDAAYVNEGQVDSVTSAMIVNGTVASGDLSDGATLAEILDDDGTGSGLDADMLDGLHASAFQQHYDNYVVVAKSGGDFTTIGAALASITDASDTNRYLVKVMPGVYSERVTMKQYVDIEGAGELTTKITFSGSSNNNTGTLVGANNAEVRFLTVANTGGNTYAIAIFNDAASPRLTHVTAVASGGVINCSMYNRSSSPTMTDVTATASGGTISTGVLNYNSSSPTMTDVTASASGGTDENYGVYNSSSSPTMTNVTATANASSDNYGVYNHSSSPTMTNVTASALGGAHNYGVYNSISSPTIQSSFIHARGPASYGIYDADSSSGSYTVRVNHCQIEGWTGTIWNAHGFTIRVGASLLNGGAVYNDGTLTCAGVYDENYAFYASTCP